MTLNRLLLSFVYSRRSPLTSGSLQSGRSIGFLSNDRRWSFNNEHRNPHHSTNMQEMGIAILNIGHHFEASLRIQHRDGGILSHRWDYLSRRSHPLVGRRRTADGRREPAEEVPSSKGKVDPEIGYGESRGKGTETTQTG